MAEILIVGSGASGTAAALALVEMGLRPVILDVGNTPDGAIARVGENLYDYRTHSDSFALQIGDHYSGVRDVVEGTTNIAKLNAPNMGFVIREAGRYSPLDQTGFAAIQSFALGGLANAWGAGLYRFVDRDLDGFPFGAAALDPYADRLTREIGIAGTADDLAPHFGSTADLLPPLHLSHNAELLMDRYARKSAAFHDHGIRLGRPRIGALAEPYAGRPACDYNNLEFWQDAAWLYTPPLTLNRLIAAGLVDYRPGLLARRFEETPGGVVVHAVEVATGAPVTAGGEALLLAAGAIGSARLALQSTGDTGTVLPLLENPAVQIPWVLPGSVGRPLDRTAFGLVQLNLVWESAAYGLTLQGSIMELTSPMRAEFFGRFPLSARANLELVRAMLPAMLLMQLYFPASAIPPASLALRADSASLTGYRIAVNGSPGEIEMGKLGALLGKLRGLGLWTANFLIYRPEQGHAIHYAGTLPMRESPGTYECDPAGRLAGSQRVYVADSAGFSSLPAKNMGLGMMCNAMRVAEQAARHASALPGAV